MELKAGAVGLLYMCVESMNWRWAQLFALMSLPRAIHAALEVLSELSPSSVVLLERSVLQ